MSVLTDAEMQSKVAEFKESIKDKTMEELESIEQDLIKEFDELNDKRKETEFTLPTKNWKETSETICKFLDKKEAAWNVGFNAFTFQNIT